MSTVSFPLTQVTATTPKGPCFASVKKSAVCEFVCKTKSFCVAKISHTLYVSQILYGIVSQIVS